MKRLVSILIMVILVVNITSCIQWEPTKEPTKEPTGQNEIDKEPLDNIDPDDSKITIKVAATIADELLDAFLEDHPDVKIITYNSLYAQDMDDIDRIRQMDKLFRIRGEEPPDIFNVLFRNYSLELALEEIEYAEPLDKYIETSPGFYERFLPGALEAAKFAGQTLVLPLGWDLEYLHYNRDIFDKLEVNYPADDCNIDDLIDIVMAVTRVNEENPKENIAGMAVQFGDFMFYRYVILAMGGKLYRQEGNKFSPTVSTDPNTVRALATLANLVENKALIFNLSSESRGLCKEISALTKLSKYPYDIWGQGKAVIVSGNNAILRSGSTIFNSDGMRFPRGNNNDVVGLVNFGGLCIHKDSENKELCWELMEYLSGDYFQNKTLRPDVGSDEYNFNLARYIPISVISLDKPLSDYQRNTMQDLMESAGNTTTPDEYEYKILVQIMKAMQKVYGGQEDLEVILKQIDEYARENVF